MDEKQIRLVVAEGCGYCEEIKEMKLDNVEILDVNTEEAINLLGITGDSIFVPAAFDGDGNKCELFMEDGILKVECNKITVIETGEKSIIYENETELDEIDNFEEKEI